MTALVYFLAVEGHAQPRYGSDQFIGCRRDRATGRLVWSVEPVGIGAQEHARYRREYTNAVRRGDLQALKAEPIEGGGMRFTVLPGGPAPTEKNRLLAANVTFRDRRPEPKTEDEAKPSEAKAAPAASAPAIDGAGQGGSASSKPK